MRTTHTPVKMNKGQRPKRAELLMPAGTLTNMKAAILYGADAVYCGTPDLSLRTKSAFSLEELVEGIEFAHKHNVRVYLTLNLYTHNRDIEKLPKFLETVRLVKPDGLIIADPGVFQYVKDNAPELELHISTQANICSWLSVKYWEDQGASLCVLAREVSFEELCEIREKCPDIKLEAFVHGAMCMTYSGRCLLSNFMAERGANQGNCAHSCRWKYKLHVKLRDGKTEKVEINEQNQDLFEFLLEEEIRPGEFMPIEEDMRGSYILNSKDLCLMPKLNDYLRIGVDSLKVEGRHKNEYYAAAVARAYRRAIDDYYDDPKNWRPEPYMKELETIRNRGYSLAFHEGRLTNHAHDYDTTASIGEWSYGGFIREWQGDDIIFELKNALEEGDVIEFLPPNELDAVRLRIYDLEIANSGQKVKKVSAGQNQAVRIPLSIFHAEKIETLKKRLPEGTVARTETIKGVNFNDARQAKTRVRIRSHQMESGKITKKTYGNFKVKMAPVIAGDIPAKPSKAKTADDGCCGRGCNGCMVFWNGEKYAKARDVLAAKKQGMRLDKKTARAQVSA